MLVYGESKQYAFRYDPKTLIGHDALILGSRNMSGIALRLAPYFQWVEGIAVLRIWPIRHGRGKGADTLWPRIQQAVAVA